LPERGEDGVGVVFVQRVNGAWNLDEFPARKLLGHALGNVAVEDGALRAAEHERRRLDRPHDPPPVHVRLRPMRLHRGMPLPHQRAVGALAETLRDDPAVVVDSRIGIGAQQMARRLLDALPGIGRRRPGRGGAGAWIWGRMWTMRSVATVSGRLAVKYIALRPPIDRPIRITERRPS